MTTQSEWQGGNSRYLSAALASLRLRLGRLAGQHEQVTTLAPLPPASAPIPEEPKSRWRRFTRTDLAQLPPIAALPTPAPRSSDAAQAKAEADVADASRMTPPPALLALRQLLGLSAFESDILFLCAAMELDTGIASLCARAQGEANRPYPTFALALILFDEPAWDALSAERALRYWRLIEIQQSGMQPLTVSPLRADERVVNFIKGMNYLDDRLSPVLFSVEPLVEALPLPSSQQSVVDQITQQLKSAAGRKLPLIEMTGSDLDSKRLVASHVALSFNLSLYRLAAPLIPADPVEQENLARLWQRESVLMETGLYLDAADVDTGIPGSSTVVTRFAARLDGVVFVDSRERLPGMPETSSAIEVTGPTAAEQQDLWENALGASAAESPGALAGQFNLSSTAIQRIARKTLDEQSDVPLSTRLWGVALETTRPRLDQLAQRLQPKANWEDLVLPPQATSLLSQIAAQVGQRTNVYQGWGFADKMSRGFGISALFAGDSGTGKTMAAEVIANQLRLNLYRIDLSAVVSKYIGETEKNLRRLFDAADNGGAILFFDEADALFGKRSEVKDSHDRYANIEINYLLQRMEAYRGLAILATNMKSALDQAFMRRLRFVVDFPFPSAAERKVMWQKVFPAKTPLAGLDFDALARLNLTGGNIQSIALNAAFLASKSNVAVTHPLLLDAARTEFRKLGRVVNELEFRLHTKAGVA
jgi:ATPase family associated with various cellular activities (AAA)